MTTNQHFIPQFYQRYWECEQKGFLWELDKRHINGTNRGIRRQAIRTRNSQDNLYEADEDNPNNAIENWYSKFETLYAVRYSKLINSRLCLCRIPENDKLMICRLFAHFSARNPINLYNSSRNNALASHFTLGEPNKKIDRRYIQNLVAFTEGGMNEIFGDDQKIYSNFEKELISCKLQFLVTDEPKIVFCNRLIEQICYLNEYYFPVCPTIVAFFSKSDDINDKEIRKMTSEEYKRFIQLYLRSKSVEKIYANNKGALENMLYDQSPQFLVCS